METRSNYIDLPMGRGINAYWHPTDHYKTLRFDLVLRHQLRRLDNTRVALIGRLCERGTSTAPDMRSLNSYIDDLYGAYFSVDVGHIGDQQFIHLCLEVLDERFVEPPLHSEMLRRAVDFLRRVIADPLLEDDGFKKSYLDQEKRALTLQTESLYNDKIAYAQWRCAEEMGRGAAWGLSDMGTPDDLDDIGAGDLWAFHQQLLAKNPIDIFVSGYVERDLVLALCEQVVTGPRDASPLPSAPATPFAGDSCRHLFEFQDIFQGKLVLGYETGIAMRSEGYAAQILFNLMWASDSQSRLFRRLREELALCYYIDSHVDSFAGHVYTAVGIDAEDYANVLDEVEAELEAIRRGGTALSDLENGKKMLKSRLVSMQDDREALMRLHLRGIVAGQRYVPEQLVQMVEGVMPEQVCAVAERMKLRAVYFLHGSRDEERIRA